jgi:hypothetical protein
MAPPTRGRLSRTSAKPTGIPFTLLSKGRFRTFLLTALTRFLANEWDRVHAQKRGGGTVPLRLDTELAETRYWSDTKYEMPPDRLYDRKWAMTLLDRALSRLEAEHQRLGKGPDFAALNPALTLDRGDIPYATLAAQLGVSEPAARMAVHRLRKRAGSACGAEASRPGARGGRQVR